LSYSLDIPEYILFPPSHLRIRPPYVRDLVRYPGRVQRLTQADRAYAVAAAAAHDLNDELTVILNSITRTLQTIEPTHPSRALLVDLRRAAQRCAWKTSGLLNYSAGRGARPTAAPLERLIRADSR
jgi:hypothetical protein